MDFYSLSLFVGCVFLSIFGSVGAIQCHQCSYEDYGFTTKGDRNCKDPFDYSGIGMVECSGQCYATLTRVSFGDSDIEQFFRGCAVTDEIECEYLQGCTESIDSIACRYCCDQNNCNSQDIREFDENLFKCFYCAGAVDDNGMSMDNDTCGRADFDGSNDVVNVLKYPCSSGTCITYSVPADESGYGSVIRACVEGELTDFCENKDFYESFGNYRISCCTGKLCNVGRPELHQTVTLAPRPAIDCFFCAANLTADGLPSDQSSCGRADFDGSGKDVALLPCDTGICLTAFIPHEYASVQSIPSVQRTCVVAEITSLCENPGLSELIFGFKADIECCYENGCNTVNLVKTDSDTTTEKDMAVMKTEKQQEMTTSGVNCITGFSVTSAGVFIFSTVFSLSMICVIIQV